MIEQLVVRCTGTSFSASLDGNLMSPAIPVGGAISVRSTRRWSEGTGAVGLSHSLDVLLPNGSYSAAAQRRPESLSPIQRRVRAQSSRAASVPPLGLDSTLDSIDEKRSALGAAPNKKQPIQSSTTLVFTRVVFVGQENWTRRKEQQQPNSQSGSTCKRS